MRTLSDIANEIVDLGLRFGVRTVTVHSVYCLLSEERDRLDLPAAIDHNCRLKDVPVTRLAAGGDAGITLHWLDPEQMAGRYAAFPDALAETSRIARLCDPALPDSCLLWPVLDLGNDQTADEALADDAMKGLRVRYGDQEDKGSTVQTRLRRELHAIAQHGFAPLFLLVADSVRFARSQSIPVSTRGSVANSLVACCTSITTVDPIEHDLLFERFLNPAREDPPDIDLDFCSRRRDEVLDYVGRTYCEEKVALVATISTMRPKPLPEKRAKRWS